MSKLAKFRSQHGGPKRNPPLGTDIAEYIIPGFAAFAATRFATRVAAAQISKRYPAYAKHAGAIASVGSFGAAWFGAHRVKYLEPYHHPIVVGSGLAALQSLIQLYAPKLGWILGDPNPAQAGASMALTAKTQSKQLPPAAPSSARVAPPVPNGFSETTAADWYTYNDSFDAGSYKGKPEQSAQPVPGAASPTEEPDMQISDLLDNSDLQLDNSDMGLFS
jgi:hypothetical protein